jgi:hypothetical protein
VTAVVGILNKHAVAVAADSAVTIGDSDNHKIFNKANKVFMLSKYHPVGIMLYNSASFMATPWETIIKVYRKQLGEKNFPTLKEYQENFLEFLKTKKYFTDEEMQNIYFGDFVLNFLKSIISTINKIDPEIIEKITLPEYHAKFIAFLESEVDKFIKRFELHTLDCLPDYVDYAFEDFLTFSETKIENINQLYFFKNGITLDLSLILKIKKVIYEILRSEETICNFTGLIFTGFGEDEIYPQLIPINISMVVDNRLRYYIDKNSTASISNNISGAIRPFAQTDVINTILQGIDPNLDVIYSQNFQKTLQKYNETIVEALSSTNPVLGKVISELDTKVVIDELDKINYQIKREKYINPLMNAVSFLSKEDLAEMAESLIYLTYLKRRITFAEESVGGPVDVAVISKGDGFVWIKRKHYFSAELNQHFFHNYHK